MNKSEEKRGSGSVPRPSTSSGSGLRRDGSDVTLYVNVKVDLVDKASVFKATDKIEVKSG